MKSLSGQTRPNSLLSSKSLEQIDWDFSDLDNDSTLHWYPATFLSAIPGSLIPLLSHPDELIVDPFCGTSTTGVEALRLGRRYAGFDTNPVATLVSKARLLLAPRDVFSQHLELIKNKALLASQVKLPEHPHLEELRHWYHEETLQELRLLLVSVNQLSSDLEKVTARSAFSAILKTVSSQGRHWGWVCDNVRPKPEEIQYKDALEAYRLSLDQHLAAAESIRRDMKHRGVGLGGQNLRAKWSVVQQDAISGLGHCEDGSISLLLTSPPYFGVADYVKSQRLSFIWFSGEYGSIDGYTRDDFEALRHKEVGSRSFRRRQTSHRDYVSYMSEFCLKAFGKIKPGGQFVLVLGESSARQATLGAIDEAALAAGFTGEFRAGREIKATRRRLMAKVPGEEILVYCR